MRFAPKRPNPAPPPKPPPPPRPDLQILLLRQTARHPSHPVLCPRLPRNLHALENLHPLEIHLAQYLPEFVRECPGRGLPRDLRRKGCWHCRNSLSPESAAHPPNASPSRSCLPDLPLALTLPRLVIHHGKRRDSRESAASVFESCAAVVLAVVPEQRLVRLRGGTQVMDGQGSRQLRS
jgi:hypothetical protein